MKWLIFRMVVVTRYLFGKAYQIHTIMLDFDERQNYCEWNVLNLVRRATKIILQQIGVSICSAVFVMLNLMIQRRAEQRILL
ncbi:hypothetical protein COY16_04195 [Candidatus Roizmanbacteria bacterium CG_4_10_14_0_2_um_filter_39_13]|uniref:Uncharacterized protein n=1 Tax=Candidatus Roizmanbacteria bacterium CG_4_10_14_0_2_um_filter_39_13 TaxID=1974825 RepID=A0A2M7TXD7_9BACT|nr:MAG: hypothetical protein COY16_04195 [Candidatus Roizmanbacteria bacterium CG_4_10_14_0_2_um_filter_39_13]